MGLLDGSNEQTMGLLGAAINMLNMSGPSTVKRSFGQIAAGGLLGGAQGYYGALHEQEEKELRKLKVKQANLGMEKDQLEIDQLRSKGDSSKAMRELIADRFRPGAGLLGAPDFSSSQTALTQGAGVGSVGPTVENASRMDAISPPQQRRQGNGFPFSLNDVTALHAMGGPDLSAFYKLATDPVKYEGGSLYESRADGSQRYIPKLENGMQLGPNGQVSVAPDYLSSVSAIKGAETRAVEGAKAGFDLLPLGYTGQDGRPIGGTRGSYIDSFGQQGQPASSMPTGGGPPQRPGLPATPANFPRVSAGEQAGRDQEALRYALQDVQNATTPQGRAQAEQVYRTMLARSNAGQSVITGAAGNAGAASGMRSGAPLLQSEAEKRQQIGQIDSRLTTATDLNKNWITSSYNPVLEAGSSATALTASLDALKTIDIKTGWGTEAKANAASVLTSLGMAPPAAKLLAVNAEKFQSVAMDRLLTTLQAQKGIQTEGDADRARQTFAQLKNTPEANQFIADFARAKANNDVRKAQFYRDALPLAQQSGDLNEIDRRWQKLQGSIWADPVLSRYIRSK